MSMTQNSLRPVAMICLWVSGIGVKVHFISEFRVKLVIPCVFCDFPSEALSF